MNVAGCRPDSELENAEVFFGSEIKIFSGYFPKMVTRASREVFCGKCGFMETGKDNGEKI